MFTGRIVGIHWLIDNKILALASADNHLKLYDIAVAQTVGGGSLNARLDSSMLTCMELDQIASRVYLGTSANTVLVYHVNSSNFQPKHLYTVTLSGTGHSISCLYFSHGYLRYPQPLGISSSDTARLSSFTMSLGLWNQKLYLPHSPVRSLRPSLCMTQISESSPTKARLLLLRWRIVTIRARLWLGVRYLAKRL